MSLSNNLSLCKSSKILFDQKVDLFHLYIHGKRNKLEKNKHHFFFFKSLFQGILWDLLRSFRINRNKNYRRPDLLGKVVIHADSANNFNTLSFLHQKYPEAVLTCIGGYVGKRKDAINLRYGYSTYPNFTKYFFLLFLYFHPKYGSKMIQLIKLDYFYPQFYRLLFQDNQPRAIFISNDHAPSSRALILVARKMGIKTIYLQHACVTEIFPPLRFDCSFLYGTYSQSIYEAVGEIEGRVYSVGNPAFDEWREAIINKKRSYKIGIAYNTLDNLEDVKNVVRDLEMRMEGYEIYLRPHPADGREIPFSGRFVVSNSKSQLSCDFLKDLDVVVAGNTSLLFEAACMNVLPLQYAFSPHDPYLQDYYGFIRNGLALECRSIKEIIDIVGNFDNSKHQDVRSRAKGYDASIGSDYEFRVKEKIFSILDKQFL